MGGKKKSPSTKCTGKLFSQYSDQVLAITGCRIWCLSNKFFFYYLLKSTDLMKMNLMPGNISILRTIMKNPYTERMRIKKMESRQEKNRKLFSCRNFCECFKGLHLIHLSYFSYASWAKLFNTAFSPFLNGIKWIPLFIL